MHISESKESILFSDKRGLFLAVIKSDTLGSAPHTVRALLIYAPSSAEREQLTTNTQQNLLLKALPQRKNSTNLFSLTEALLA